MDNNSIHIYNILKNEKRQSEIYLGVVTMEWEYYKVKYQADCMEAVPLTLLEKTICGVLDIDGEVVLDRLGYILGLNVSGNPEYGECRDEAEYELLQSGIQSLLDDEMVIIDDNSGGFRLTEIGREYYHQGRKFRNTEAKEFVVYLDKTTSNHGKAGDIFSDVDGYARRVVTPIEFREEDFLKGFLHEQSPSIYDLEKGNSFTNLHTDNFCSLMRVPVQFGVFYDALKKMIRFMPVIEDKFCPELIRLIASKGDIREDVNQKGIALLKDEGKLMASPIQESFEQGLKNNTKPSIPDVIEPEEFWQGLSHLVGKDESSVFLQYNGNCDKVSAVIEDLCDSHPGTNVFLSLKNRRMGVLPKPNLFCIYKGEDNDYLLCSSSQRFFLGDYALQIPGKVHYADMVFRCADYEANHSDLMAPFANGLLDGEYKRTMSYLDGTFNATQTEVSSIAHCDDRLMVFRDYLNEQALSKVLDKKAKVLEKVKLEHEKVLLERLSAVMKENNLDDVDKVKGLDEISQKVNAILQEADDAYVGFMESAKSFKQAIKDREKAIKGGALVKTYIIDTNVLLTDPRILNSIRKPDKVVLSGQVLQELDKMKNKPGDPSIAANAREAVNIIKAIQEKERQLKNKYLLLEWANMSLLPEELRTHKGDNYILGVAMKFLDHNPWIITMDKILAITSESLGIFPIRLDEFYKNNEL